MGRFGEPTSRRRLEGRKGDGSSPLHDADEGVRAPFVIRHSSFAIRHSPFAIRHSSPGSGEPGYAGASSLADAEGGEDDVENALDIDLANDIAQGVESLADFEGDEFGGFVGFES